MINAIAIDDEPFALKVLEEHAYKINFLQLQKTFTSPLEGMAYLRDNNIDTLFLDIKMHDISGLELAAMLPAGTRLVFTTAFPDFALDGFELNAVDYLLKPISFSRFLKACHKLKDSTTKGQQENYLMLKDGNEIIRAKTSDIFFIEATGNYLKVHTANGNFLHRKTMKEFLEALPFESFIRVHKSYIVNLQHINRIEPFQLTIDNQKIPVSTNYKADVWSRLGIQ